MENTSLKDIAKEARRKIKINKPKSLAEMCLIDMDVLLKILESKTPVKNPIGMLIDERLYNVLNKTERQQYVRIVTSRFLQLQDTYLSNKNK